MSFSAEDRQKVGAFFTEIISTYYSKEPVYYEHIRGHLSKAPEVVRLFVRKTCKGEELLNYFRKRKNYFEVDGTLVSLKKKVNVTRFESPSNVKAKAQKPVKFVRSKSESFSSSSSDKVKASVTSSNSPRKLEHEEYVFKHFARSLEGGKGLDIESIDFEKLPRKVTHFLTVNYDKSLWKYFDKFPNLFRVKDKIVFLSEDLLKPSSNGIGDVKEVSSENANSVSLNPEQQKAIAWLMSIEYFHSVLKKTKGSALHVDKLAGYLSQAPDYVKKFVNSYKPLIDFFMLSPALFSVSPTLQVSPTKHFNSFLKQFKNKIYDPSSESQIDTESTLLSDLQDMVKSCDSSTDEVEDDAHSTGTSCISDSKLNEDKESRKSSVNDHWGAEYESEGREIYDDRLYDDYETDEDYENDWQENYWDQDYKVEPYNQEMDYVNHNHSYNENFEEQTSMHNGNGEDIACVDNLDLQLKSSGNESEEKEAGSFSTMELTELREERLKFLFKVQLYCVEAVENKNDFFKEHEVKCINFFMQYLKAAVGGSTITSLQGSLGQADPEVASFMKKLYKGNKFPLFFQEHEEFNMKSLVVTLSSNCGEIFKSRLLSYTNYKKEFNYETLYESSEYINFLKETFAFVSEVIKRLMNSNKLKCSRIYSIVQEFPTFLESTKLYSSTPDEETGNFLRILDTFDILEGLISLSSKNSPISIEWLQKVAETSLCSNSLPIDSHSNNEGTHIEVLSDNGNESFELLCEISDYLTQESVCNVVSHYWEVVDFLPSEILFKIEAAGTDSRIIIGAMVKIGKSLGNHTEISVFEDQDDLTSKVNQTDHNFLDMHNETEKVEEAEVITSQFLDNLEYEGIIDENNQIQGSSMHQENTEDEDEKDKSCKHNTFNYNPSSLAILDKQQRDEIDSLISEICGSQESGADDNPFINPTYDEIPISKDSVIPYQDLLSAQNGNAINEELNLNNLDIFEKQISSENLNIHGHKNRISSNSDSDLFESIPSSRSIEKMPCKNEGGYTSDVTDCSENIDETCLDFMDMSESTSVSDLDEAGHYLSEVDVIPIHLHPNSPVSESESLNKLENAACIHKESELPLETEDENFALQNSCDIIGDHKSEDLNISVPEKDIFEGNESVMLNGCENKSSDEISVAYLPPTNSEIKSTFVMEKEAWSLAKNLFSTLYSCKVVYVASAKLIFSFERRFFLNLSNTCESEVSCDTSSHEDNAEISQLSSADEKELLNDGLHNERDRRNTCKVSKNDKNDIKSQNPLQPIEARIILLTSDSCIAQVLSSKQTIYFLKCVFSCNEELCCSDCFDGLKIGDIVSCFVPIPELSRKVWIPIMVSKERSQDFNGADQINKILKNQIVDDTNRKCEVGYQLSRKNIPDVENVSVQTEEKSVSNGDCQTELESSEVYCQTDISGEVAREVASCQTEPVLVADAYVQVCCNTISSDCQTELSYSNATNSESQTDITGCVKNCVNTEMSFCQTNLSGEIKEIVEMVDQESQTIATGPVFSQQFFHL